MIPPRILLITGDSGVGKSYLVQRLIKEVEVPLKGFYTQRSVTDQEGQSFVWIQSADRMVGEPCDIDKQSVYQVGASQNDAVMTPFPGVFDEKGCEFLKECQTDLWVMDELGFLELEAHHFREAVLAVLDGPSPVIAVIKSKKNAFLDQVCAHPDAEIYEVTELNREQLYTQLSQITKHWFGHQADSEAFT